MNERGILQLVEQGGVVMYPLLVCSVVSLAVIIERLWWLGRTAGAATRLAGHVRDAVREGRLAEAAALCRGVAGPWAEALRTAVAGHGQPLELVERAVQRKLNEANRLLRRHIWLLGTIGSLAPFIGLFGTVLGIIRSFESMAATGSGGFAVVAAGISEALIATAGGLLVGVLAIFAYNAFNVRITALAAVLRDAADEVVQAVVELPAQPESLPRAAQSR